jgi:hypothetical protein
VSNLQELNDQIFKSNIALEISQLLSEGRIINQCHVLTLCNSFIHSFIFIPNFDEGDEQEKTYFNGVLVNSDYSKDKALYLVSLDDFLIFINEVISDFIVFISLNRRTGEHKKSRSDKSPFIPNLSENTRLD